MIEIERKPFSSRAFGFATLSWKRMIPGLADAIIVAIIGAVALRTASTVLVSVLALNIALMSFSSMIMMHNRKNELHDGIITIIVRFSLFVSISYIVMSIISFFIFGGDVQKDTIYFLLLSIPRPFLSASNIYLSEVLFRNNLMKKLQKITTYSILLYTIVNVTLLYLLKSDNEAISISVLLIGVFSSQIFNTICYYYSIPIEKRPTSRQFINAFKTLLKRNTAEGFGAGISVSLTNILEIGFLAIVGWVLALFFPLYSLVFYPTFVLMEWASGLALGISRTVIEDRIAKTRSPNLSKISLIYFLYCGFCSAIFYIFIYNYTSLTTYSIIYQYIIYCFLYIFCDGLQLIFRGVLLSNPNGKTMKYVSLCSYAIGGALLLISLITENIFIVALSCIIPHILIILSVPYVRLKGEEVDTQSV